MAAAVEVIVRLLLPRFKVWLIAVLAIFKELAARAPPKVSAPFN